MLLGNLENCRRTQNQEQTERGENQGLCMDNVPHFLCTYFQKTMLVGDLESVTERNCGRPEKHLLQVLKSKFIVCRCLYIIILTCCELQTGK